MESSLHNWTIIFLFAAGQGFFLSALLLFQKTRKTKANRYLATIVLLFSLSLVHYVAFWTKNFRDYPHLIASSDTFIFLYGPLMCFYLRTIFSKPNWRFDFLHFIPFAIVFASWLPFYFNSGSEKIRIILEIRQNPDHIFHIFTPLMDVLGNLHLLIYTGFVISTFLRNYPKTQANPSPIQKMQNTYLQRVVFSFGGFTLGFLSYYLLVYTGLLRPIYDYAISVAMSFFIYTIGYMGYRHPQLFSPLPLSKSKYENSTLKSTEAQQCVNALQKLMETEKIFLDNELKIKDVADKLSVSVHHLSQTINEQLNQSYSDLINSYRVQEAQKRLLSTEYEHLKIIAVAYDVGFNNKASFNTNFKKFTGMSPSEFRKKHQTIIT